MIRKLYPGGRKKAFNITFDDGVLQDVRFVEMLNRYGLKGTFNLNSQLMAEEFEWQHPCGMVVKRLSLQAVKELYNGHETASHTLTHPYMHNMDRDAVMYQLKKDRENLEAVFNTHIGGFAVPFDYYSPLIADCAEKAGFEYARMSQESLSYTPSRNYYYWQTGVFHLNPALNSFVKGFFETDEELALCQIVGHSYDLDAENMWESTERMLEKMAADSDVASMTNIEIVRYLKAMEKVQTDGNHIFNNSDTTLWFDIAGQVLSVLPHSTLCCSPD